MASTELERPVAGEVASWARALSYEAIPESVLRMSRMLILDAIGVAVAATSDPLAEFVRGWADADASPGLATALSVNRSLAPADAAFVNGTLIHGLDFDDHGFGGHASACILPALLAVAESHREAFSGRDLLTAYVAGMEAFGSLSLCTPFPKIHYYGFHPTPVFGELGAAVAIGKLLALEEERFVHTLALSVSSGVGLTANFGTNAKPMHAGWAAAAAVRGEQYAAAGLRGNPEVLEEDAGFGTAYMHDDVDWTAFVARLARDDFRLDSKPPSIKQYPCCGGNQRAIQNLLDILRENSIESEEVVGVDIHINPNLLKILQYPWATTASEGKFSLPFTTSVALAYGGVTLDAFADSAWNDPAVLRARNKITLIQDLTQEDRNHVEVVVRTSDREIMKDSDLVRGTAANRMTESEVSDKYQVSIRHGLVDPAVAADLQEAIEGLEGQSDRFWSLWRRLGASRETADPTGI